MEFRSYFDVNRCLNGNGKKLSTNSLITTTCCLIKFIPFKETPNSTLPDVDFEVASHQEGPDEVKINAMEFWERVMNIERSIQGLNLVLQGLMGPFESGQQLERTP